MKSSGVQVVEPRALRRLYVPVGPGRESGLVPELQDSPVASGTEIPAETAMVDTTQQEAVGKWKD
jgi:hypothetical protein